MEPLLVSMPPWVPGFVTVLILAATVYGFIREKLPPDLTSLLADAYLGGEQRLLRDPRVSPIFRAVDLPPAHIAVGSADPLIEDAQALRAALAQAGKRHDYQVYEEMPHAFMQMEFLPAARIAITRMTRFLHQELGG